MLFRLLGIGLGTTLLAAAQNPYEFQREIQHRRDFQRELESYASRPNAPLRNGGGVDDAAVKQWVAAKESARQAGREEAARRERAAALREEERLQARRELEARAQREKQWRGNVGTIRERLQGEGFAFFEAQIIAEHLVQKPDGSYVGSELASRHAQAAREAMYEFTQKGNSLSADRLMELHWLMFRGCPPRERSDVRFAPYAALRCLQKRHERFPQARTEASIASIATELVQHPHFNLSELAERRVMVRQWIASVPLDSVTAARDGLNFANGTTRWQLPPDPELAAPFLEAGWNFEWEEIRRFFGPPDYSGKGSEPYYQRARTCALNLARIHEARGDLALAGVWYARSIYQRYQRFPAPEEQAPAALFFERHPETLRQLPKNARDELMSAAEAVNSEAILRELLVFAQAYPANRALIELRLAEVTATPDYAVSAAPLLVGPHWGALAFPKSSARLFDYLRRMAAPATPEARAAWHRLRALIPLYLGGPLEGRLRFVPPASESGALETDYARAVILTTAPDATPAQLAEGKALLRDLTQRPPALLWGGKLAAPQPQTYLALATLFSQPDAAGRAEALTMWAESDDPWASYYRGLVLCKRFGDPAEWALGVPALRQAAARNIRPAQSALGVMTVYGRFGVQRDPELGFKYLAQAGDDRSSEANFALAECHANGWGTPRRPDIAAADWATVQGSFRPAGLRESGRLYLSGNGLKKDEAKGRSYLLQAAQADDAIAQLLYGTLLLETARTPGERTVAVDWWRKSAAAGYFQAGATLYVAQAAGTHLPKDLAAATRDFERFLETQSPRRQAEGALVLLGRHPNVESAGVEQREPALKWLRRAAAKDAEAKRFLAALEQEYAAGANP